VVVADILTVAAALAAEMDGRPWATLVPHVLPTPHPGFPAYAIGARLPRTAAGRAFWRLLDPIVRIGAGQGRRQLNGARARVGLAALEYLHNGTSRERGLVATLPQLVYSRAVEPSVEASGPLMGEHLVGARAGGGVAESASRVAWAGVGVALPRRLVSARGIRLAVERVLADPAYAQRAGELGDWAARNDGAARAAEAVEAFAARTGRA